jgi:hypothetical protein
MFDIGHPGYSLMIVTTSLERVILLDSSYRRHAAFCRAFFCRRGRRDLFFGGSFPFFTDFLEGLAPASEASLSKTVAGIFLSVIFFGFSN